MFADTHQDPTIANLTKIRQAIQSRPPAITHFIVLTMALLISSAAIWVSVTPVNLVVIGRGSLRPQLAPQQVFVPARDTADFRVLQVFAKPGQRVRRGDLLVTLSSSSIDHSLQGLESKAAAARAELEAVEQLRSLAERTAAVRLEKLELQARRDRTAIAKGQDERESRVREAQQQVAVAEASLARLRKIGPFGAASQAELEQVQARAISAREELLRLAIPMDETQLQINRQEIELARREHEIELSELNGREARATATLAQLDAERMELRRLKRAAEIRAPATGVVTEGIVKPGDLLVPGSAIMKIADDKNLVFEGHIEAAEIHRITPGNATRIVLDSVDRHEVGIARGIVSQISPDSETRDGAAFYKIRVEVCDTTGRDGCELPLRLGVAGNMEVIVGSDRLLSVLVRRIRTSFRLVAH